METNGKYEHSDLNDLVLKLKDADGHYARISKRVQFIYWALVPIYLVIIILDVVNNISLADIGSSLFYLMGMTVFALIFRSYYKEYNFVDYTQSTLIMLKKAARRYYPCQGKVWLVVLGLICIDAGLTLRSPFFIEIVKLQIIFWGAMFGAVLVGLFVWWVRYKPLRDEALRLIRDIETYS